MEKQLSKAVTKGLPSHAERPDLYDGFDGLQHTTELKNPVGVPSRLQALIAERQAKAGPRKPARKSVWKLNSNTVETKTVKKSTRKGAAKATTKRENRHKVAAAV